MRCPEIYSGCRLTGLGLFFDEMINTFDPDALIVGGGAIEASQDFQRWFIDEIRAGYAQPAGRAGGYSNPGDAAWG